MDILKCFLENDTTLIKQIGFEIFLNWFILRV